MYPGPLGEGTDTRAVAARDLVGRWKYSYLLWPVAHGTRSSELTREWLGGAPVSVCGQVSV